MDNVHNKIFKKGKISKKKLKRKILFRQTGITSFSQFEIKISSHIYYLIQISF